VTSIVIEVAQRWIFTLILKVTILPTTPTSDPTLVLLPVLVNVGPTSARVCSPSPANIHLLLKSLVTLTTCLISPLVWAVLGPSLILTPQPGRIFFPYPPFYPYHLDMFAFSLTVVTTVLQTSYHHP
jgi:hypothetical protein